MLCPAILCRMTRASAGIPPSMLGARRLALAGQGAIQHPLPPSGTLAAEPSSE